MPFVLLLLQYQNIMKHDVIIIGGGIVGLAAAYHILLKKPNTRLLLLEKENAIAQHQTGNNSGVIHSGIYYKPGSLKAKNCMEGYHMLLEFAQKHDIPYDLCGKIIVATLPEELPGLETLYQRGLENGLTGLKWIEKDQIKDYEPHCAGIKALFVPQTGIIDYKLVAAKYAEAVQNLGGEIKTSTKVLSIKKNTDYSTIETSVGSYNAAMIVNCAGLYSDKVASMTTREVDTRIIPFRGEYFMIKPERQYLVKNLIYPVPDPAFPFLGVHFTRMMNGHVEAGPNAVLAFRREGYKKTDIHPGELWETLRWPGFRTVAYKYWKTGLGEMWRSFSKAAFTKALQRLIPEITEDDLEPANAGVRAQACDRNGGLLDDFKIIQEDGIIHILNAPSPAATSSLSIGKTISEMIE
jgi:L-2-hydroxyglutarate oxidase